MRAAEREFGKRQEGDIKPIVSFVFMAGAAPPRQLQLWCPLNSDCSTLELELHNFPRSTRQQSSSQYDEGYDDMNSSVGSAQNSNARGDSRTSGSSTNNTTTRHRRLFLRNPLEVLRAQPRQTLRHPTTPATPPPSAFPPAPLSVYTTLVGESDREDQIAGPSRTQIHDHDNIPSCFNGQLSKSTRALGRSAKRRESSRLCAS
ncbi:hypothetical protein C8J56DRAFT_1043283 [Mycena floridula]|nr:hypothetical protein C8J56DRAFT_1043283 [Mycena floridula]